VKGGVIRGKGGGKEGVLLLRGWEGKGGEEKEGEGRRGEGKGKMGGDCPPF